MDPLTIIALGSAAVSAVGTIFSSIFGSKSNDLQEKQLALQEEQLELQKTSYYDDLQSSYYSYMSQLEDMNNSATSAQTAINQAQEDIASNEYYLSRWADEYDSTISSAVDSAYATYAEQANALGTINANNASTGRTGGSAGIVASIQQRQVKNLVGDSLSFNLNGLLGTSVNTAAQDALAERQTAATAINTSYQSISTYQDTISNLNESIASMSATTEEIKKKLEENGRTV